MATAVITIPTDAETARIYAESSAESQRKVRLLLSLWLRNLVVSPRSLQVVMDEISEKAQARGLTPEILETLLHEE
jgi:hypothetical protein